MSMTVSEIFVLTDWSLLTEQKLALIEACTRNDKLDGLLGWIDAIQDAAAQEGYPVWEKDKP
jgi:hypothetical protein